MTNPYAMNGIDPLDWATVQPHTDALLAAPLTAGGVPAWLRRWSDLEAVLDEALTQIYREVTENTKDEAAEARFQHFMEDILPQKRLAAQALREKLLAVPGYQPDAETATLMQRIRSEVAIFRAENVPIESKLEIMGNEYNKIVGAMTVDWQGESETIPQARKHLEEPDRGTRELAWRKIQDCYLAQRERIGELFLSMLPLRQQTGRNAGFANFRDYRWLVLDRFDYTPQDCFTFHDAIEREVVPLARKLYQRTAGKLGLDGLRPWDTDVDPNGEPLRPFADVAELEATTQRIFDRVDPALGRHFASMRDGFLDLATRPNKALGGYCSSFPISQRPYIFMNAAGTNGDVMTMLHEGGHAFHFLESVSQPLIWNYSGPMEFCEVASMSMELLAAPYLAESRGGFYSEADARRAYAKELRSIVFFLPYMAVVDAFQHWVYVDGPADPSPADLDRAWSELWERFMPDIDYGGLQAEKETGWQRKGHIFDVPFYYIEYGLAQLGALQVWRNALRDQAQAVADYRGALALGYTRSLPELFQAAGARFAFDRRTVGELMALIEEQLGVLEGG